MTKPKFTDLARYPTPYVPSGSTDISRTFARIRAQLKAEAEAKAKPKAEVRALRGQK